MLLCFSYSGLNTAVKQEPPTDEKTDASEEEIDMKGVGSVGG